MKTHTSDLKNNIKRIGRVLDSKITYTLNNEEIVLGMTDLNSVTPSYTTSLLKSVMKQLDIDSNVEIPEGTIINYKLGVLVNGSFEYLNYGNYVVYKVEKQEDVRSYKITCYDKMLYAMKDYEAMNITYPITIRDYIAAIATHLGLTFANSSDTFANYNREIANELYLDSDGNSLGYTFRDVLDELAQVTASNICINEETDELEVRYITNTNDTINEEFFKDINVTFKEKYGPVNSIVLSRAAGPDNVYLQDETSIEENGLCEVKITDNQIMNWNDRSDYLPGILGRLNGLEYYLNDYSSTGIFYYNVCDKYYASIDGNSYPCIMFNDEINITQGAEENIYTDMPEETETDYTKSDKTDRKINQAYFIIDKQNKIIQSVVNTVTEQNSKISQVTQTVDELNSKISDIADITISGESSYATFDLDNINQSEPIMIKIRPTTENISYLYPSTNLYPSSIQYLKTRTLRFYNKTTSENIDYILPDDLLIYNSQVYDEFYLDYDSQTCQVTKRCGYNADGSVYALATEQIVSYSYPQIVLTDGDYTISLQGYQNGYLFTRLMAQNIYTSQFATRAEVSSSISQTAQEINLEVSKKVGKDEVVSAINQSAEQITLKSNRLVVESDGFTLDGEGNMAATSGEIGGFILNDISFTGNINGLYNYNDFDRMLCMSSIVGNSNLDNTNINILDATEDGRVDTADLSKINRIVNGTIENTKYIQGTVEINSNNPKNCLSIKDNNRQYAVQIGLGGINSQEILARNLICGDEGNLSGADPTYVIINGPDGKAYFKGASTGNIRQTLIEKNSIVTNDLTVYGTFNNSSDKKLKENIINLDNSCSKIVKELTPISYTFKKDKNKKTHYGFIAQDVEKIFKENNMQPPTEIKDGTYTLDYLNLIAILWKDNQKLHEEIDKLKEMIKNA